jgi:hypothetical protein
MLNLRLRADAKWLKTVKSMKEVILCIDQYSIGPEVYPN